MCVLSITSSKREIITLARWVIWLEHNPVQRKVTGSILGQPHTYVKGLIPGWGANWRQPINVSLCLSLSNQ